MAEPVVALLGNSNPQMTVEVEDENGVTKRVQVPAEHLNQSVTSVELRPDYNDADECALALSTNNDRVLSLIGRGLAAEHKHLAIALREFEDIVQVHMAGDAPAWVSCPGDPLLEAAVAAHFQCPIATVDPETGIAGPTMLLTNAGRDALHGQHIGTSAQPAAFFYGALTADTGGSFATSDTTLAGEITTGGGGLVRAAMTFAHTTGTNTSTLTKTYTANGSDSLPVTVASWANFNASSSGTMGEEDVLSATATLNVIGDNVTVTFTLTAG